MNIQVLNDKAQAVILEAEKRLHEITGMTIHLNPIIRKDNLTMIDLVRIACDVFGEIEQDFWFSIKSRRRHLVMIRNAVMMEAYPSIGNLRLIGKMLGGRDHSTVLHGISQCRTDMQYNKEYRDKVQLFQHRCQEERLARSEQSREVRAYVDRRVQNYFH